MAQTNILDYGKDFNKDLLTGYNILVSTEFLQEFYKCTTVCYKCNYHLEFKESGYGAAKMLLGTCSNQYCEFDKNFTRCHKKG